MSDPLNLNNGTSVPVTYPLPTSDYTIDTSLDVLTEYPKILLGESLKIDIVGTSNIDIILEICRKKLSDNFMSSDMVVDIATAALNSYGLFTTFFKPETDLLTGDNYHYYPRVRLGTSPANTARIGNPVKVYDRLQSLIAHIDNALGDVQSIPVYDELSKDSINGGTNFRFTYNNWNNDYPVVVIKNGEFYDTDYFTINYTDGIITTNEIIPSNNELNASYVFKFFSNYDLRLFLERSISTINMISPVTSYNYSSFPDYWYDTVIMESVLRALESLFTSAMFKERQVIFGDKDVITSLNSYYSRLQTATDNAKTKIKKMHDALPAAISGHDVIAPPRTTGGNFRTYAWLRGKAL